MGIGQYRKISVPIRGNGPSEQPNAGPSLPMQSRNLDRSICPHRSDPLSADVTRIPAVALSVPDALQLDRPSERFETIRIAVLSLSNWNSYQSESHRRDHRQRETRGDHSLGAHIDQGISEPEPRRWVGVVMAASKLTRELPSASERSALSFSEHNGIYGYNFYVENNRGDLDQHIIVVEADGQGPVHTFNVGLAILWNQRFQLFAPRP